MDKSVLRKEMFLKRNALSREQIIEKSKGIFQQLYSFPLYERASTIMTYVSFRSEVTTHDFIENTMEAKKKIIIPVCKPDSKEFILSHLMDLKQDLEEGYFGLLEPKKEALRPTPSYELDMILVPGLAFTEKGLRLGYGGGYYDRFLSSLPKYIPTIALAFELQIVENLPAESYDIPVDYIVTEKRMIACKHQRKGTGDR